MLCSVQFARERWLHTLSIALSHGAFVGSNGQILDGTFDEYWYDALGRRVLVRSLRQDLCQASPGGCESTIERTVWAGDQVLYEIRAPGGSTDNLDAAPPLSHRQYGIVGYTHGGGIDQPLTVIRRNHPAGVTTIVPHANYRGVYRAGTTRAGTLLSCAPNGNCVYVNWPAPIRGAYHQGDATGGDWIGSLIPGMQDASGLLYKRNRYYNPATGQFTQADPIGIAGGLNTYGFAEGDPISYNDPFGLCPKGLRRDGKCPGKLTVDQWQFVEKVITQGMTTEASDPLLDMLYRGRIKANERMGGPERRVQAVHKFGQPSSLRLGPSFFGQAFGDAAFTLSHDYGHVIQKDRLNLIYGAPEEAMSEQEWFVLTRTPDDAAEGEAYFNRQQDDANRYACSVIRQPAPTYQSYCSQQP